VNGASSIAWLVDLVIAFTLIEAAVLLLYRHATGKGVAPREFALNMVSGLCLMLALRAFASDAAAPWTALCLLGAGVAHGTDMWLRWRRGGIAGADADAGASASASASAAIPHEVAS
jgi:hypothetical protein